jgi:hypothetical protein
VTDAVVAYSPKGAGILSGLLGVVVSPNKVVGVAVVVLGSAVDTVGIWWDRRKERKKNENR